MLEMTQAEYARRCGMSAVAIAKAIDAGRIPASAVRRDGKAKLIDVAAADLALGKNRSRINTPAAELAENSVAVVAAGSTPAPSETASLTKARTLTAEYDARLKELEVLQREGETLSKADARIALERIVETIIRNLSQLPARADDLATAFSRAGVAGLRSLLKEIEREIRRSSEATLTAIALGAEPAGAADDDDAAGDQAEVAEQLLEGERLVS